MGILSFSLNATLDGCVDHQEGIADNETHAFFTRLMDEVGAMLWGRVTYEMMEDYLPAVARGDEKAPPAMREWAIKLEAKPKYVVSSTRTDFPWTNSHHIAGDLRTNVQKLKDATPAGVLLGSGQLATARAGFVDAAPQWRGRHALPVRARLIPVAQLRESPRLGYTHCVPTRRARMTTIEVLKSQRERVLEIAQRHGVVSIRVFGSVARGEEAAESDIDFLVTTGPQVSSWFPARLILDLEELLGRHIDFVTESGLNPHIRGRVLSEAVTL